MTCPTRFSRTMRSRSQLAPRTGRPVTSPPCSGLVEEPNRRQSHLGMLEESLRNQPPDVPSADDQCALTGLTLSAGAALGRDEPEPPRRARTRLQVAKALWPLRPLPMPPSIPRSAIVIAAAAMATAVTIDRVASSIRRSSGGRYIRLFASSPITRAAKTNVQRGIAAPDVRMGREQRGGWWHRSRARFVPRRRSDAFVDFRSATRLRGRERTGALLLRLEGAHGRRIDTSWSRDWRGGVNRPPAAGSPKRHQCHIVRLGTGPQPQRR